MICLGWSRSRPPSFRSTCSTPCKQKKRYIQNALVALRIFGVGIHPESKEPRNTDRHVDSTGQKGSCGSCQKSYCGAFRPEVKLANTNVPPCLRGAKERKGGEVAREKEKIAVCIWACKYPCQMNIFFFELSLPVCDACIHVHLHVQFCFNASHENALASPFMQCTCHCSDSNWIAFCISGGLFTSRIALFGILCERSVRHITACVMHIRSQDACSLWLCGAFLLTSQVFNFMCSVSNDKDVHLECIENAKSCVYALKLALLFLIQCCWFSCVNDIGQYIPKCPGFLLAKKMIKLCKTA